MKTYKVGELRKVIRESASEFKPVMGEKVVSDDKKNNDKAYKDMEKQTSDYNKDMKFKPNTQNTLKFDNNRGMQDLVYNKDAIDKKFADRVKSQMNGYTDTENEKKHKNEDFGNAEFGTDMKDMEKKAAENEKDRETARLVGLAARTHPEDFKSGAVGNTILDKNVKESKSLKRLHFKKTTFLGESHMISKIPEEFKTEGNKFIMEDNSDNRYMVEWNFNKAKVLKYTNKNKLNEQLGRIKSLFNKDNDNKQQSSKEDKLLF